VAGPWRAAVVARLARTLGIEGQAVRCSSRVSACRRELNSHQAAEPQAAASAGRRTREGLRVECGPEGPDAEVALCLRFERVPLGGPDMAMRFQDSEPWPHIANHWRTATIGFQSVCRAAAASIGGLRHGQLERRLENVARQGLQRGAGSTCGCPSRDSKTTPRASDCIDA
jgi:hypothetical protein